MEITEATRKLAAISQETRLEAFRLLMVQGPEGMAAGDIARRLDVPASTLSSHLSVLENAGLVSSTRIQRSIRYAIDIEGARGLVGFLIRDCCRGHPEICVPALSDVSDLCQPATPRGLT